MRSRMAPLRFQTRLLAFNLTVVGALAVLSLVLGYDLLRLANLPAQEKSIELKAELSIQQLVKGCELELAASRHRRIHRLVDTFRSDPDVASVLVHDKDERLVGAWGDHIALAKLTAFPSGQVFSLGDRRAIWAPVEIEGIRLGTVSLAYSLNRISSAQRRAVFFTVAVLVALAISVFASLRNARMLTRPIKQLRDTMERLAEGELQLPEVTDVTSLETNQIAVAFSTLLQRLQALGEVARQIAAGDLTATVWARGELADAFRQMIQNQRALVQQIAQTAVQLTAAMAELQSSAEQQQRGAFEQSSSVEENQRTMSALLDSARQVADTAQGVLQFAERTHGNSRQMAERIGALASQVQRITEILQVIKEIANKSELLALNAALEGTRAGEAGRGFSLVANQMQRLAENVVSAVRDIKELTETIIDSTRTAVMATEESTKLAAETTRSARQIVMISNQQQGGTEEMSKAMKDVSQIAHQAAAGSKQIVGAANDMVQLSARLRELVGRFRLESERAPRAQS